MFVWQNISRVPADVLGETYHVFLPNNISHSKISLLTTVYTRRNAILATLLIWSSCKRFHQNIGSKWMSQDSGRSWFSSSCKNFNQENKTTKMRSATTERFGPGRMGCLGTRELRKVVTNFKLQKVMVSKPEIKRKVRNWLVSFVTGIPASPP